MAILRTSPRRRKRCCRGQSTIEAVLCLMFLLMLLFGLVQVAYLYMGQMVAHHASFVTARSYVVGYNVNIVERAAEVGTIGLAGKLVEPAAYAHLSPGELGEIEPVLIGEFVQWSDYLMEYEHWDHVHESTPMLEMEGMVPADIHVIDYPLQLPLQFLFVDDNTVDFSSTTELFNHAAHYLE